MMREKLPYLAALLLSLGACRPDPRPVTAPAPVAPLHRDGMRAPFALHLSAPDHAQAGEVALVATLRGVAGSALPVRLSVVLPRGARLLEGQAEEALVLGGQELERRFVLAGVPGTPSEPVRFQARHDSAGMGAFAERLYPEPRSPAIPAEGGQGRRLGPVHLAAPVPTTRQ